MRTNRILILITVALIAFIGYCPAQSTANVKVNKMSVQGTSSLHDWESEITKADWKGSVKIEGQSLTEIKDVEVKIPVEGIKSTKGKMMDNKTYDAFKYEKHPFITYILSSVKINAGGTLEAKGNLTMAGTTKAMDLTAKYKVLPSGELQLVLSRTFKMSDFKMETPTAMMGTIKVGDEVTVNFDVILNPKLLSNKS